jgi:peptidoglycan hydrolase CwlO-like protein
VVSTLVAALLLALPLAPAGAAPSEGGTQAQIDALRGQIDAGAAQIHQATESFDHATVEATSLHQQLETEYAQLATLRKRLGHSQSTLQRAAVASYTGAATTDVGTSEAASTNPDIGAEYLSVASGDVDDTIDAYEVQKRQVAAAIGTITSEQRSNQTFLDQATKDRGDAIAAAGAEQQRLDHLQAQLDALVAADRPVPSTQGLPVNNGIVKSTQAQTAPSSTPPPAPVTTVPSTPTTTPAPTPTSPPTTPPTTTPTTTPPSTGGGSGGVWLELRTCESGDNYAENTGNGYYGAYQFSAGTWTSLGYPGRPDLEPPAMQDAAAMRLQASAGWGQWPACSAALGL